MFGARDPQRLRGEMPGAARFVAARSGMEVRRFDEALAMFNAVALAAADEEGGNR